MEIKVSLFSGKNHRETETFGRNLMLFALAEPVSLWGNHSASAVLVPRQTLCCSLKPSDPRTCGQQCWTLRTLLWCLSGDTLCLELEWARDEAWEVSPPAQAARLYLHFYNTKEVLKGTKEGLFVRFPKDSHSQPKHCSPAPSTKGAEGRLQHCELWHPNQGLGSRRLGKVHSWSE